MQVENMNGKIYEVEFIGKGIDPVSVGEILTNPPQYFIGRFDSVEPNSNTLLHLFLLTDSREDWNLVHCWLREAIYYDADVFSIPKGTYTKSNNEVALPKSIEQSDFELKI